jgi:hypothetical protein
LAETKSTPQEDARLEISRIFLDKTVRCLGEYVHGMKAELVFNLDEVGVSEWEDRKDKKVAVAGVRLIKRYIIALPET